MVARQGCGSGLPIVDWKPKAEGVGCFALYFAAARDPASPPPSASVA